MRRGLSIIGLEHSYGLYGSRIFDRTQLTPQWPGGELEYGLLPRRRVWKGGEAASRKRPPNILWRRGKSLLEHLDWLELGGLGIQTLVKLIKLIIFK